MNTIIAEQRSELSLYAPKIIKFFIDKDKIKDVIGPGGKVIKGITEATGSQVIINDSGEICITSKDEESATKAYKMIEDIIADVEVGKVYEGTVVRIVPELGAFVQILPGKEGLCHISQLSQKKLRSAREVVKEGDKLLVIVREIDRQGRINLSHTAAINKKPQNEARKYSNR
jgi:polyribonucleotide nucleotidyltransferase